MTAIPSGAVRTVLGDIDASSLGVTYAHEHLVIDPGRPVELFPDFQLDDVDRIVTEVEAARAAGLEAAVDAMPCDAGRNVVKLAAIARRTGLNVIAPTGLHHGRYYRSGHWSEGASAEELGALFIADILDGIDERDYSGPLVRRTEHRAGVVKVAGSHDGPSARDQRVFEAAAIAHIETGVPILTHCEEGTGALEQLRFLGERGVPASSIALSHVDKVVDRGYHREILSTGAFVEYDQSFRWGQDRENGTLTLLGWMLEDDFGGQVLLGMDAARQGYLRAFGGAPGLAWLLEGFSGLMSEHGIGDAERLRFFVDNPARAFAASGGAAT